MISFLFEFNKKKYINAIFFLYCTNENSYSDDEPL